MRNIFIKLICVIFTSFTISCSNHFFHSFHVEKIQIIDNKIKITFSSKPDFISIKNSLTICQDDYYLDGIFTSEGNSIIFTPFTEDFDNHDYKITLSTEAEDTKGISLLENYHYSFSTKPQVPDFKILNFKYTLSDLTFNFTNQVDEKSFHDNFTIKPETPFIINFDDTDKMVVIKFTKSLSPTIRYFITLNQDTVDIYNNKLKTKYENNFIINPDIPLTDYEVFFTDTNNALTKLDQSKLNESIPQKNPLTFKFSQKINMDSVTSGIIITPKINFKIEKDLYLKDSFKISFTEFPEYNSTYELIVKDSITDIYSKPVPSKTINLRFNNSIDIKPDFITMILCTNDSTVKLDQDKTPQDLIFNPQFYPTVSGISSQSLSCYLLFSSSPDSTGINIFSAMENITFSTTNSCISITPEKMDILNLKDIEASDEYSEILHFLSNEISQLHNSNLIPSIIKIDFKIQNSSNPGLIKININQNLCDSLNNKIKDNINLLINKK